MATFLLNIILDVSFIYLSIHFIISFWFRQSQSSITTLTVLITPRTSPHSPLGGSGASSIDLQDIEKTIHSTLLNLADAARALAARVWYRRHGNQVCSRLRERVVTCSATARCDNPRVSLLAAAALCGSDGLYSDRRPPR